MIVFTYRSSNADPDARWKETTVLEEFFDTQDDARSAVLEIRTEITAAALADWSPFHIERVELAPISGRQFLTLINKGVRPFVRSCEVVETID